MYRLRVFSPNHSCAALRAVRLDQRVLLRLGSTTPLVSKYKYLELNSIKGVKVSSNKILMKKCFDDVQARHSDYIYTSNVKHLKEFFNKHKILIAKHKHSCKGKGIYYIDSEEALNELIQKINISDYIFEEYRFFPKEYRVHIDVNTGCFYACLKKLNKDADVEWHKHGNNSTFVHLTPMDKYPDCWDEMIEDCKKVMRMIDLTICCFDVLCSNDDFILLESNTAPALGSYGLTYYSNHLMKYYNDRRF